MEPKIPPHIRFKTFISMNMFLQRLMALLLTLTILDQYNHLTYKMRNFISDI